MKKLFCRIVTNEPHRFFFPGMYSKKGAKGYVKNTLLPVIIEQTNKGRYLGIDGQEFEIFTKSIGVIENDIIEFGNTDVLVVKIEN